ncbi:hypothetical protein SSX86_031769 [Deinandra increscens subsp. villosa]|uniref:Uncharacterized protein n=1 Tax=Deinandra increscens subsp. villosa TaxID=3103831 RepID=A0AAP0C3N5_9ASTR
MYGSCARLNFPDYQSKKDCSLLVANPASSCDSTTTCSHSEGGATNDSQYGSAVFPSVKQEESIEVKHEHEIVAKEQLSDYNNDSGFYVDDEMFDLEKLLKTVSNPNPEAGSGDRYGAQFGNEAAVNENGQMYMQQGLCESNLDYSFDFLNLGRPEDCSFTLKDLGFGSDAELGL